jgi:methylated-DNA-[protein]-cysteine S-methyltransferase
MPRRDFTTANVAGNWFFYTDEHQYFRRVYPGALAFTTFRNADGILESGMYAFWVEWDAKSGGTAWIEPKWFHENVLVPFSIGDTVTIPAGNYDFADLQIASFMGSGRRLRTDVDFRTGTYFDGRRTEFDLPLASEGSEFQKKVWAELRRIPYGETATYGEIARRLGYEPVIARAVGVANASNPLPIVVPCHRVIGSDGKLTGYAGGVHRKSALLELEQPGLF